MRRRKKLTTSKFNQTIKYAMDIHSRKFKTLNIKDPHLRLGFKAPKGRDDEEFEADIFNKIQQICDIAVSNEVDAITMSGDVFDIKEASRYGIPQLSLIHKALTMLRESTKRKLLITIAGNHDLPNSSRKMKEKSVYGYFQKIGLLTDIHKTKMLFKMLDFSVEFYGIDYNNKLSDLTKEIKEYDSAIKPKEPYYKTLLLHEHLVKKDDLTKKKETKYLGNRFTYGAVLSKFKSIDVFIAGHYHFGYPTYKSKDGRLIINNWNLTRLARNYYVLNGRHIPNVTITTYTKKSIDAEDIDLKVRDYATAINLDEIEVDSDDQLDVTDFVERMQDSSVTEEVQSDVKLNQRQQDLLSDIIEEAKTEIQE